MKDEVPNRGTYQGSKYLGAGFRFGGAIVMFLLGGYALDRWLHTVPLFLVVGTLLGTGLGFVSFWRELQADQANRPTWKKRKGGRGGPADSGTGGSEGREP